ncbi:hypothetical protein AYI70_g2395 [Smittium culicis]|uniref:Uncharacterized protein n=1 Tax=Smittium culicis TaxID=133412 RepID=A0A1R1Y8Q1_9FUNG|nr:hypothetical protein AYI70_g2395 [Smittium culicis]
MQVERVGDCVGCHSNALLETDAFRDVQGLPELNARHFKLLVIFKERCVGVQERDETRSAVEIVNVRFGFSYARVNVRHHHARLTRRIAVLRAFLLRIEQIQRPRLLAEIRQLIVVRVAEFSIKRFRIRAHYHVKRIAVPLERLLVVAVSCRCLAAEYAHDVRALVAHPLVRLCKPVNHPDPAHQILLRRLNPLFIATHRRQLRQAPRNELVVAKLLSTKYQIDNLAQRRVRLLVISKRNPVLLARLTIISITVVLFYLLNKQPVRFEYASPALRSSFLTGFGYIELGPNKYKYPWYAKIPKQIADPTTIIEILPASESRKLS